MNEKDKLSIEKYGKEFDELCFARQKIIEDLIECGKEFPTS